MQHWELIEEVALQMSDLFPSSTEDERDPREDQSDSKRREDEIKGDKPPHHDD